MRQFKIEKDFIIDGYRCAIIGQSLGHRCGYVGIPKGHVLYGKDYSYIENEFNISVHGGLTFSDYGDEIYPVKSDENLWWLGFDCGHSGDGKDFELIKELNDENHYQIMLEIEKKFSTSEWETVKTTEYVEQELTDMVKQIKVVQGE